MLADRKLAHFGVEILCEMRCPDRQRKLPTTITRLASFGQESGPAASINADAATSAYDAKSLGGQSLYEDRHGVLLTELPSSLHLSPVSSS